MSSSAVSWGHAEVVLHTTKPMQLAWGMYEKLGFVHAAELDVALQTANHHPLVSLCRLISSEDSMSLTQLLIPTFTQFLQGLSSWLDKAAAHRQATGAEPDALLSERLAADMYPLAAQVRFACFQALEPVCRLRGVPLPDTLLAVRQEGWNANAQPGTWSDAKARIADALALLDGVSPNALDEGGALPIALELPNGVVFDMTGEQYARDWALPQFYFHVITAYAILRNQGVELGKADYVSYMLAYMRPGTMPQG